MRVKEILMKVKKSHKFFLNKKSHLRNILFSESPENSSFEKCCLLSLMQPCIRSQRRNWHDFFSFASPKKDKKVQKEMHLNLQIVFVTTTFCTQHKIGSSDSEVVSCANAISHKDSVSLCMEDFFVVN